MPDSYGILPEILGRKRQEVAARCERMTLAELQAGVGSAPELRGFVAAIQRRVNAGQPAVIAEAKKASPSKGVIREDFDIVQIARSYEAGGASCMSVLTDENFFQGSDDYLRAARAACHLPLLRKDFIIDPYQVYETRVIGADCMLLIAAALEDAQLAELAHLANALDMDVLMEVHDADELERVLALEQTLIGINNRNLQTFDTSLNTTLNLLGDIPDGCIVVTESGIHTAEDVKLMRDHGVDAFLVGEALMREPEPGVRLRELFGQV